MNKKAFTLIELLAVIVILAIISLIAVPIVINIINDSKYESQKRSIDHYAEALKQSVADYQLKNNKKVEGKFNTTDGKILTRDDITLNVNYKGNVVCNRTVVNKDGSIYLSECSVDGDKVYINQEESKKENSTKYYEYGKTEYGMLMENKTHSHIFLNTGVSSSKISRFEIHTDGINIPEGYESADCSYNQDGSVMCYWKNMSPTRADFEMHIASDGEIYTPYDSSYLFCNLGYGYYNSLPSLDFTGLNTSKTTNMSHMFYSVGTYVSRIVLGNKFDTSNVIDMESMFQNSIDSSITTFTFPDSFDTSKVTDMSNMFDNSFQYTQSINLGSNFNTSNVRDMSGMFKEFGRYRAKKLNLGDNFDTSNVRDMSEMFYNADITNLNLGGKFDTSSVTNMKSMFERIKLKELDLGDKFDTSNVTDMSYMFYFMGNIKNLNFLNKLNTSSVTNMSNMFAYLDSPYITELNLPNNFNTSSVTNMKSMFECTGQNYMTKIDLGDNFDTSNVTTMENMFYSAGYNLLTELDLGDKFDTSNVVKMSGMFAKTGYENLEELNLGDKFDTSNVYGMGGMFANTGYKKLKKLDLGSKFVKSTKYGYYNSGYRSMFEGTGHDSMTELNMRNFSGVRTGSNYDYQNIFKDCGSDGVLTKVIVSTDSYKNQLLNDSSVPQFWKDNNIIEVQSN